MVYKRFFKSFDTFDRLPRFHGWTIWKIVPTGAAAWCTNDFSNRLTLFADSSGSRLDDLENRPY